MHSAGYINVPLDTIKETAVRLGKSGDQPDVVAYLEQIISWRANEARVSVFKIGGPALDVIYEVAKENKQRGLMSHITSIKRGMRDPSSGKIGSLKALPTMITMFLLEDLIDGWLYEQIADDILVPWNVSSIRYVPRDKMRVNSVDMVHVALAQVRGASAKKTETKAVVFCHEDIIKNNVASLMAQAGYYHETPEMKSEYERNVERFKFLISQSSEQFWTTGAGWSQSEYSSSYNLRDREQFSRARVIVDETLIKRFLDLQADRRYWDSLKDDGLDVPDDAFSQVPHDCMVFVYNLLKHDHYWYHSSHLEDYDYNPEMIRQLVLPDAQKDIIDVLTQDHDILQDDIVDQKGRGSVILSKGPPGVGKTLTAEVYSEVMERPLYRVDPAQLGSEPVKIAANLQKVLDNTLRWKAVLLVDEADVYVRRRDNDRHHNEVVATFLTTLEYFDGLMFLTTNRGLDIDEAVESRCIAMVQYELPTTEMLPQLYRVHARLAGVEMADELIEDLIDLLGRVSGRDIRMLFRLVGRYVSRGRGDYDYDTFKKAAVFRGLSVGGEA